jgi:fatty-acyl-CoA synthase
MNQHASASPQHFPIELDWLKQWAMYSPEAIALVDDASGETITYREAYLRSNRLARYLMHERGIKVGDRVAVLATNELDYILLYFALQKTGAMMVPMNHRLSPRELQYIVDDAQPTLVIEQMALQDRISGYPELAFDGVGGVGDLLREATLDASNPGIHSTFEAPVMILYTSGTTGNPKGAVLSNRMIFWNSVNTGLRLNLVQQDKTLTFAPFFHTGGWNVLNLPFLHRGAQQILLKKFDPDRVIQLIGKEKISILFGVPTMMDRLRESPHFEPTDLRSIRYAVVGGEPMPLPLIKAWHTKGVPVRQGYGLTEFGPNVFSLNEADAERKMGSIGFPNFYIETRIVDDLGNEVTNGEAGELLLRGTVCMNEYWNHPEATAQTIVDGWVHTGDVARCDDEGYFYIVDRKKDMFISGAENVYPAEVEKVLRTHPDIREVAVVGVPDPTWGEVGMAYIALKPGTRMDLAAMQAFCNGQLARYKIPKYVRFIEELPKSDSGKLLKRALSREL